MRHAPPAALAALASALLACAAPPAPHAPDQEGLPLTFPPAPLLARSAPGPEPEPPPPGAPPSACPLQWIPRELGASVVHIPPALGSRMMAPFFRALCACTRPGQSLVVVARLVPDRGEVTAHTEERSDVQAHASRSIDACLTRELGAHLYEPFHLGSDVVCESPSPPSKAPQPGAPAPIWVPRRAGCAGGEDAFATMTMPVHVDRRDERR